MTDKRKICVITGSRAEYGLLKLVMKEIRDDAHLTLQVIATGTHLSKEFGRTYSEIEDDGFQIDLKVEMLMSSDSPKGISKSMGLGLIGFSDALKILNPDLVLVLGDRYEILSAVIAALPARIPVAHLHGGEITEGLIDEAIRHSITKMSHLHFVATEQYRKRVIQLGERPENVFLVGGLGVDSIKELKLLSRIELEAFLGCQLWQKNLLITFHPVTLEKSTASKQIDELLKALEELKDIKLVFTMPNADTEGRDISAILENFVHENHNCHYFKSLGQRAYLSCLQYVDGVIGNSSSGLMEVPSFRKGTINIGDRQKGRMQASSVINCKPNRSSIITAIQKLYSQEFCETLKTVTNPYGDGGASEKIVSIIRSIPLNNLIKKRFYDI